MNVPEWGSRVQSDGVQMQRVQGHHTQIHKDIAAQTLTTRSLNYLQTSAEVLRPDEMTQHPEDRHALFDVSVNCMKVVLLSLSLSFLNTTVINF